MENAEQITQAIQSQLLGLEIWETKKRTLHRTNYEQFGDRQVGNDGILRRVEALVTRIERRQLPELENHTLTTIVRGFEKNDSGGGNTHGHAAIAHRSRMLPDGASATRTVSTSHASPL